MGWYKKFNWGVNLLQPLLMEKVEKVGVACLVSKALKGNSMLRIYSIFNSSLAGSHELKAGKKK